MNTPYFPVWRRKLAVLGRRTAYARQQSPVELESQCHRFLSKQTLQPPTSGRRTRRRVFFLSRVFWCFVWQALQPRTPCRTVVRQVQAFCETERRVFDESTSAYCQARQRLPLGCLQQALTDSAQAAERLSQQGFPGWTRPIKVVDGTGLRLPDTEANRTCYPYPTGQKPGCGFPVMKILALYSLTSGAILKTTMGMEELRCKSPAMLQKELLAFLVAHNFMRCLIAESATTHQVPRTRISFKGAIDAARSFYQAMRLAGSQRTIRRLYRRLLEVLACDLVPLRPGRSGPRAVKRRPKPYQRLTKPRRIFKELAHRGNIRGGSRCLT